MPSYSNSSAMRSGIEAQVDFLTELTRKTFDSARQLGELNLHFAQQVMQVSAETTRQLVSCRDPLQFVSIAANASQPALQHLQSYQQQLTGMLTGAQLDLTRGAEALMPEHLRHAAAAMMQNMSRQMPSGGNALGAPHHSTATSGDAFSSPADGVGGLGGRGGSIH